MIWMPSASFVSKTIWPLILLVLGTAALLASGCTTVELQDPPSDVKAFFVAGNKANLLALQNLSPNCVDLSAYDRQIGVRYPPTFKVDILRKPPSRPYKVFAVLEYDGSEGLMEGLKNKAKEIGADALILCNAGSGQGLPGVSRTQKMQAVAIKYKIIAGSNQKGNL